MKYFWLGIIALFLSTGAWGEETGKSFLHRVEWQINTSLPLTFHELNKHEYGWGLRASHSYGLGMSIPWGKYVSSQIQGDYFRFKFVTDRYYERLAELSPKMSPWLANIMLNIKWHFTQESTSFRPYIVTGIGLLWGHQVEYSRGEDCGEHFYMTKEKEISGEFGLGLRYSFDDKVSCFTEAGLVSYMDTGILDLYGTGAMFCPVKFGFSFRY